MLGKPAKFEFAHRLLGGALHGSNGDEIIIGFKADAGWSQTQRVGGLWSERSGVEAVDPVCLTLTLRLPARPLGRTAGREL
jgi:hypothetical protein